jgi:predicted permease
MKVMEIVLPVIVMILIGMLCKKRGYINKNGVDNIKFLVTKIMLPVAIFHALGTAQYNKDTAKLVGIMLIMLLVSFSLGFLLKPLMVEPYKKYLPFMVSIYEGGMMAYPLYVSLCGSENLSKIAVLDIAALLFGFSIYIGLLSQTENKETFSVKKLATDALKNPAFIASGLGVMAGVTGILQWLIKSSMGTSYLKVETMVTTSLTAMILIVVGYSIEWEKDMIAPCLRTIFIRICLQAVMLTAVLITVKQFLPDDQLTIWAIIIYMSAPATFSMQTFLKDKRGSAYVSTTNSIHCLITVLVYVILAVMI